MLEMKNVSVTLGGRRILDDVSLTLRGGRVTVLLGKNGSGKSTLIRAINRQTRYAGEILLDGKNLRDCPPRERARRVGFFPQTLPETGLTVRELAELGRNPYVGLTGRLSEGDRRAVERALERTGMRDMADRTYSSLSGGERQRAFMALLLAQEADTLLLDEPAAWLDIGARRELAEMIRFLARERGCAVLAVWHDLNEAVRMADDVAALDGGRIVFEGGVRRFLEEGAAEKLFGVRKYECGEEKKIFFE